MFDFLSFFEMKPPICSVITSMSFIMDEIKAIYTGMAVGGVLGSGAVIVGTFAVPVIGPIVGTFLFIGGILGGAAAGGNAALKIAEKINRKNKEEGKL